MARKINTFRLSLLFTALFFTVFSLAAFANHPETQPATDSAAVAAAPHAEAVVEGEEAKEKPVDITAVAFEHILDSHSWHFWGEHEGAVSLPLPVILKTDNGLVTFLSSEFKHDTHGTVVVEKSGQRFVNFEEKIYYASEMPNEHGQYLDMGTAAGKTEAEVLNKTPLDLSITKNVAQMLISAIVLFWLFVSIAASYKNTGVTNAPKGKQSFFEPLIVFVRDDIAKGNIGPSYEKFVPYLLTVFFLILINNVFGMIPIGANLTGNIAFTLTLAVCTLIITNINGNKNYWSHIFLPHAPKAIWPILIPIEIVGVLTKPFALMIRLFANMSAGHIIVISLIGLIFFFKAASMAFVSVPFALFIDVLECLVAFLQAYIFTMLTALFIGSAVAESHDEGHHSEEELAAHKH